MRAPKRGVCGRPGPSRAMAGHSVDLEHRQTERKLCSTLTIWAPGSPCGQIPPGSRNHRRNEHDAGVHHSFRNRARNWVHSRIWRSGDYFLSTPSTGTASIVPLLNDRISCPGCHDNASCLLAAGWLGQLPEKLGAYSQSLRELPQTLINDLATKCGRPAPDHWTISANSRQHTSQYQPVMIAPFLEIDRDGAPKNFLCIPQGFTPHSRRMQYLLRSKRQLWNRLLHSRANGAGSATLTNSPLHCSISTPAAAASNTSGPSGKSTPAPPMIS
jgi:hypothetical protein